MLAREAYELAQIIVDGLRQFSQRIEIAGSIRRAREQVNDIDLVVEPKPGQRGQIKERILQRCVKRQAGDQSLIVELPLRGEWARRLGQSSVQLDVWFAEADEPDLLGVNAGNWGSLLVCRTGSAEHNIRLCAQAQTVGLHWNPYRGVMRGTEVIASRTEEEVFAALGLQWIPPAMRESVLDWDDFRQKETPARSNQSAKRISDADAHKVFDRIKAMCAGKGDELKNRVMVRREIQ